MFGFDSRCVYEKETERKQERGTGRESQTERRQFDCVNYEERCKGKQNSKKHPAPIPFHLRGGVRQRRCNIITAGTLLFPMIHLRQSGFQARPMNGFSVSQG